MQVLGIETSTPVCSVALVRDGRIVVKHTLDAGTQHAERLTGMVCEVLDAAGLDLAELDGVAVGAGPGSFTGLRIGMATAKGLCMACDLPLLTVPTLAGLALPCASGAAPVCAMLDARRGEVYAGVYELEDGHLVAKDENVVLPVADLLPDLPRPILLVGDGACAYREEIRAYLGSAAHFAPEAFGLPCGGAIGLLGTELLARGDVADLASVEPRYLRRSQAERVRRERMASAGG